MEETQPVKKRRGRKPGSVSRPPLERTFAQVSAIDGELCKLFARLRVWEGQAPTKSIKNDLSEASEWVSEATCRLRDVAKTLSDVRILGFKPEETRKGFQPGDRVEIRKNSQERFLKLADRPDDLSNLAVHKVVDSDVILDVIDSDTQTLRRFGAVNKGMLVLKKGNGR